MQTYVDDSLMAQPDVYFEGGDHQELVHMSGEQFSQLMSDAGHGQFSRRMM